MVPLPASFRLFCQTTDLNGREAQEKARKQRQRLIDLFSNDQPCLPRGNIAAPVIWNDSAAGRGSEGDGPFLFAYEAGNDVRATVALQPRAGGRYLAVLVPAASPIKTAADLVGHRIATGRGSIGHELLLSLEQKSGVQDWGNRAGPPKPPVIPGRFNGVGLGRRDPARGWWKAYTNLQKD